MVNFYIKIKCKKGYYLIIIIKKKLKSMKKYYENNNYQHKKKLSMIINIINQKRKISLKINDEDLKINQY